MLAAAVRCEPCGRLKTSEISHINQTGNGLTRNLDLAGGRQYGPRGFQGDGAQFLIQRVGSGLHNMSDGADGEGRRKSDQSPDEAALSARLGSLDQRLSEVR